MSNEARKYQGLIVLNVQGKDESIDNMVKAIGKDIEEEGGKLDQIDKMGKREFAYAPRKVTSGYYVNYHFTAAPTVIESLRSRLKLNGEIYMQHYERSKGAE